MPIFLKEENKALKNNTYLLPTHLHKQLQDVLKMYGQYKDLKGYKRLKSMVDPTYNKRTNKKNQSHKRHITYHDLKRIKHDMKDLTANDLEYTLNGGEEMKNFIDQTLNSERNKVKNTSQPPTVTKVSSVTAQNVVKPSKPAKVDEKQNKIIIISEKQLKNLKNYL